VKEGNYTVKKSKYTDTPHEIREVIEQSKIIEDFLPACSTALVDFPKRSITLARVSVGVLRSSIRMASNVFTCVFYIFFLRNDINFDFSCCYQNLADQKLVFLYTS
jgi:hypothetical protein